MIKSEFIRRVSKTTGVTQKNVALVLDGLADTIIDILTEDNSEKVSLPYLGAFKLKKVNERSGISQITGNKWTKPAYKKLCFEVSPIVKETIE